MRALLLVGLGGFVGATARYGLSLYVRDRFGDGFPAATLVVNLVGCLAIGALLGWARESDGLSEGARLLLAVGLLGSFTTFSTFGFETLELVVEERFTEALGSIAGNVVLGVAAVWVGTRIVG